MDKKLFIWSIILIIFGILCHAKDETKSKYFETLTVLKNIEVSVDEKEILIDFSKLYEKIKKDKIELLKKRINIY